MTPPFEAQVMNSLKDTSGCKNHSTMHRPLTNDNDGGKNGNGFHNPNHPSLENLRLIDMNGRSHSQRTGGAADRECRVRFQAANDEPKIESRLFFDVITGLAALVCSMSLIGILVMLYLIVRPFSVSMARRLSATLGAASFLDALALLLPNTKIYLTGDSDIPSPVGTSVLVCNHVMDGDWYAILMLARCVGLKGSVKAFLRNEILQLDQSMSSPKNGRINTPAPAVRPAVPGSVSSGMLDSMPAVQRSTSSGTTHVSRHQASPDLSMCAALLHTLLEFPLMNGEDYISNRENLFQLLRSFANRKGAAAPVHLLLFPEGWSVYNGKDRKSVLARSQEFAAREGRPQLKHLLLPRTTGFNASLDCLRESCPVVFDVTMAYRGYDGSVPPTLDLSLLSLWNLLRNKYPREIHFRIKRYSMEEVLQDASWLDKKWAEKDRLLHHFAQHNSFPADGRGFAQHRVFHTRFHSIEVSILSVARLLLLPCATPIMLLLSIPLLCGAFWAWFTYAVYKFIFPDSNGPRSSSSTAPANTGGTDQTPIIHSANSGTPFFPVTPFASPLFSNWRDMLGGDKKS